MLGGGGRETLGVDRPLTRPSRHRLCVVGSGVALDHSLVGTLPICFDLMGFSIYSFAQINVGKRLLVYSLMYFCICLANNNLPNTCGTWSVVNAYVF